MTRVLSALALLPVVFGIIWFLPPLGTLVLGELVLLLAFKEYADICVRTGVPVPRVTTGVGAAVTCAALSLAPMNFPVVLMAAVLGICVVQISLGRQPSMLASVSAAAFTLLYLAVPIGALVALRTFPGREVLVLLLLTVMASDTAQYYGGRAFGRRPLAPTLSPKKTVAGAVFGMVAGMFVLAVVGHWWMVWLAPVSRVLLGATMAALGIAGDLFESSLKRSAEVKDASSLIPGHGGVLDRLDGILFAAPVYYAVVVLAS